MDAHTPPSDVPNPDTEGVSGQDSVPEPDPRDTIRAPSTDDPEVDGSSSVNELISYGRHALTKDGLATRIGYLWRRRAYHATYLLKTRPKSGRRKGDFGDLAESLGYSRSQAYKLAHLWPIIDQVDAWAVIRAEQSKRRRNGIEKWPSDEDILTEFPSPLKPTPKSREEREEAKREEEEARARAKARGNTGETPDVDALVAKVAELTNALEFERATLARERQIVEALNAALEQKEAPPAKPQVLPEGVLAQDSSGYSRRCDLFASFADDPEPDAPDPVVPPEVVADDSIIVMASEPANIVLSPTAVVGDERDEIERQYGLSANWARKSALNDTRCRNIRAFVYREWGARLTPAELKAALKLPKTVWSDAATVGDVLAQIATLMAA